MKVKVDGEWIFIEKAGDDHYVINGDVFVRQTRVTTVPIRDYWYQYDPVEKRHYCKWFR